MSYKKINLNSQGNICFDTHRFINYSNPNFDPKFNRAVNGYVDTELVFDENERLLIFNGEKLYYDESGKLSQIITKDSDENGSWTCITAFEYFDESTVLKKTVLVKSESFFSANNIAYTTDGINKIIETPQEQNKLLKSEIITSKEVEDLLNRKLYFYNELNYDVFKLNPSDKITDEDIHFITTTKEITTEFGNKMIDKKKFYTGGANLLAEMELSYECIDKSELPEFDASKLEEFNEECYFLELNFFGKQIYSYDNQGKLNYLEDDYQIAIIDIDVISKTKIEKATIIDKRTKSIANWYCLCETRIDSIEKYKY